MTDDQTAPPAPVGLGAAGQALWRDLAGEYELELHEVPLLAQAARLADVIAALDAVVAADGPMSVGSAGQPVVHPAVAEARQTRIALARLLGQVGFPSESGPAMTAAQRRATAAARTRWGAA